VQLDDRQGFVFDIDGTLVHRDGDVLHVQPGAREVLGRIRASGRRLALFTNGSHVSPAGFAAELRAAGLEIADDEVLTPLRSVQTYLRARGGHGSVLLLGNAAGRDYLVEVGVPLVEGDESGEASLVFVATPEEVDFPALERAARVVLGGARLLTGSYAPAYAGANGPILSRGAMVTAALAKATGARPVVVGKPSRAAVLTIGEHFGTPTEALAVIGDDVTMDVALGRLGGARTILVRTGISGRRVDLERLPEGKRPHAVVDGVGELLDWL
jgi:HAD superfamily hydrolase (TIGR01450 family)